ncbi:IST1 homolog isoform X1 [Macadamia integrifolia]|uniref:IST1 homolog isoform X1 n=1 Tax=Macadamia integrifolia TaxID=60698 RepID=UPI001C4EAE29|nr:IST1 homolog isoform X1 [Macadamia integrifolia]
MRKEIAKLLETGQEATARIRVKHIIREENMMAAQEIVELFCELVTIWLPIIEAQRECPLDLKESISSICFAAPRCADLPELQQVQMLFASKYGREFVSAATELMPDWC